ncbi:DUF3108 domain-containing protein [Meiothermus sp. QL-1]|uniref:DUF3108 domain-containing protein n=1 Tax=Meiothermus sp. QL-1 TaxID=2058095 RepID=UPI000E0BD053|nr:DUF3108 domain-containing protein [Meiothermus sp. QL-1]RDI96470.1 DUF3108 domain-containing protein [Meiothermus sp. QL-1]
MRGLALLGVAGLSLAQAVPWAPAEQLAYRLSWQGVDVGRVYLVAEEAGEGWRFRFRLEPTGPARWLGYGLEAESRVGPELFTTQFRQTLSEPFRGTTRLFFQQQDGKGCWATVVHPDGKETTWKSPHEDVLDSLALLYYLRLYPEIRQVRVVDYYQMVQGRLEVLQGRGLMGYRFARDDVYIEAWYRSNARRTLVRLVFGRDFGRLEAVLLEDNGS